MVTGHLLKGCRWKKQAFALDTCTTAASLSQTDNAQVCMFSTTIFTGHGTHFLCEKTEVARCWGIDPGYKSCELSNSSICFILVRTVTMLLWAWKWWEINRDTKCHPEGNGRGSMIRVPSLPTQSLLREVLSAFVISLAEIHYAILIKDLFKWHL